MTRIEEEQEEQFEEQSSGSKSEPRYEQRGLKRTGTDAAMPQLREEIDPQLVVTEATKRKPSKEPMDERSRKPPGVNDLSRCIGAVFKEENVESEPKTIMSIARSIFTLGSLPKVSEIYSPPRLIEMCEDFGLAKGNAYDLETKRKNGEPFDLTDRDAHREAWKEVEADDPALIAGGPPCGPFSRINEWLNFPKMTPEKVKEILWKGYDVEHGARIRSKNWKQIPEYTRSKVRCADGTS